MDIRTLQTTIIDALEDMKAQDILVFDTQHLTSLFDRIIIASGSSNRHTRSLAMSVRDQVKNTDGQVLSIEGLESGEWVLVDCGDAVVHIMQPMIREYYKLEQMWGDKPVAVKLGSKKLPLKQLSAHDEDQDEVADETNIAVKTAVKKAASKKVATKVPAAKKVAAKKTVAKKAAKAPAKSTTKSASKKSSSGQSIAVKKASASTLKKPSARIPKTKP